MRYSTLQFSIVVAVCIIMAGCTPIEPEPPRAILTFDYTPREATPGSADVTFAIVGAQIDTPVGLFRTFARNMANDFGEILTARGFSVKGPFQEYDLMTYSDKEGSDLVLTAEVGFTSDLTQLSYSTFNKVTGPLTVSCHVNLVARESLTNNRLWTKSVAITPVRVEFISRKAYPNGASLDTLLVNENQFHTALGRALEAQYTEIMNRIYGYLEPKEMVIVKQAAQKLREQKVFR